MEKELKIAVIGGGSSYTPELIEGFIKRAKELPVKTLYLVDIETGKEKLEIIYQLTKRMIAKTGLDIEVYKTLDRREAIKDADFVITQIRVGGLKARAMDERIPLKYGVIGQETTGPGGFAKALRTIPVLLGICKDIEALAPEAWLINFTNPVSIVTEMIHRYSTVKTIGLCNVPISMINNVAKIYDIDSSRVRIDFVGLNHMVYGKKVYIDGEDATAEVLKGLVEGKSMNMKNIKDLNWDAGFISALGMLPCPYHRYFYLRDEMLEEEIKALEEKGSRAEQVMKLEESLFKLYQDPNLDRKPKELEERGGAYYSDAAVSLVSAIYNDKGEIHTVNILNKGGTPDLSEDVVLETNAMIYRSGAKALSAGRLPETVKGLIQAVKAYEVLTVEAGISGNYNTAIMALLANPLVPSYKVAKDILDDIIAANTKYLPQFSKDKNTARGE